MQAYAAGSCRAVMTICLLAACLCGCSDQVPEPKQVAAPARPTIRVGDRLDYVLSELGPPSAKLQVENQLILTYDTVEICATNGVVATVTTRARETAADDAARVETKVPDEPGPGFWACLFHFLLEGNTNMEPDPPTDELAANQPHQDLAHLRVVITSVECCDVEDTKDGDALVLGWKLEGEHYAPPHGTQKQLRFHRPGTREIREVTTTFVKPDSPNAATGVRLWASHLPRGSEYGRYVTETKKVEQAPSVVRTQPQPRNETVQRYIPPEPPIEKSWDIRGRAGFKGHKLFEGEGWMYIIRYKVEVADDPDARYR